MLQLTEIATIFGNLQDIFDMHLQFKRELEPIVAEWTPQARVAHLFKKMV